MVFEIDSTSFTHRLLREMHQIQKIW